MTSSGYHNSVLEGTVLALLALLAVQAEVDVSQVELRVELVPELHPAPS